MSDRVILWNQNVGVVGVDLPEPLICSPGSCDFVVYLLKISLPGKQRNKMLNKGLGGG